MDNRRSIDQCWAQIHEWHKEYIPENLRPISAPPSDKERSLLSSILHARHPEPASDFIHSISIQNGLTEGYFEGSWTLFSASEILIVTEEFENRETSTKSTALDRIVKADPAIKAEWWNHNWVPIMYDSNGNYILLDLDPGEPGTVGQLVLFSEFDQARSLVADSWMAFLNRYVDQLEIGTFSFQEDELQITRIKSGTLLQ